MKLLVVRHGETQLNAERRYVGALDPELNANGVAQAQALRSILPGTIDVVVCSPLRAVQTAEIVCRGRSKEPMIDCAFRERNVGVFEGLTQEEANVRFPDLWVQNITRVWHRAPTDGETIAEVVERVAAGLCRLYESHQGRIITLVAHGFVAKVIRSDRSRLHRLLRVAALQWSRL